MTLFNQLFRARVKQLRTMFLATGGLAHNGEKGTFREAFVKELLELFLPVQFGVGSGVIIDSYGRQSPQVDLLIFDKRTMPPILEMGGHGIYAFDSVLRVLEVKSIVDGRALDQFSDMLWSLSPRNKDGLRVAKSGKLENGECYYPVACLYGFESRLSNLQSKCAEYEKLTQLSNMVFVDGIGMYSPDYPFFKFPDTDFGIAMFIALLLERLTETADSRADYDPSPWLRSIGNTVT